MPKFSIVKHTNMPKFSVFLLRLVDGKLPVTRCLFPALETLIFSKRAFGGHPGGTQGAHFGAYSAPSNIHIISALGQKGAQGAHFFSVSTGKESGKTHYNVCRSLSR